MLLSARSTKSPIDKISRGKQSRRAHLFLAAICLAMLASAPSALSALAQADSGPPSSPAPAPSLDSLWVDQAAKNAAAAENASAPASAPKAEMQAAVGAETAAPMCKLNAFKDSSLVSKGGWPGIGPFKPTEAAGEFVDDQQNKVHLDMQGDQIGHAELTLGGWQPSRDVVVNVLNLQMDADFLLEALGIKPARIQDLNVQIEKKRDSIFKDAKPVSLTTGRFVVGIDKRQADNRQVLVISINSLDANKNAIKQAASSENDNQTGGVKELGAQPIAPPSVPPVDRAQLKSEFAQLINNWQQVKKNAVKARQTEKLDDVLSGKALSRQVNAIKWLVANHRYYEMDPKNVTVDQFTEILPGKKYMVAAQVHEAYKFVDEQSNKVLKEVDDTNRVNYTVEKIAGKWMITDSALLSPGSSRTISVNKTTH